MAKSTVVDSATGKSVDSQIRTSSGTFLHRFHDDVVADVERRIAEFSMVPVENGEGVQILRYEKGQKYEAHYDYFHDRFNADPAKGGQRVATLLMYLTDVEEGGETVFPASADKPYANGGGAWSDCARRGVAVKPRQGDAILFFSLDLKQQLDSASLHAGCPVIKGVKWSATKWMHVGAFGAESAVRRSGCADYNDGCPEWARAGECTRNAPFMVGSDGSAGECLKSCNKCTPAVA
jgi:prolyl 4-hydroxylase